MTRLSEIAGLLAGLFFLLGTLIAADAFIPDLHAQVVRHLEAVD